MWSRNVKHLVLIKDLELLFLGVVRYKSFKSLFNYHVLSLIGNMIEQLFDITFSLFAGVDTIN